MIKSSRDIGQEAVEKLKSWLATSPVIPIHKNQVNKAEICRRLGITRSTIGSNSQLRMLFNSLAVERQAGPTVKNRSNEINMLQSIIQDLDAELVSAKNEIVELRRQILFEEHLIVWGQVIDE